MFLDMFLSVFFGRKAVYRVRKGVGTVSKISKNVSNSYQESRLEKQQPETAAITRYPKVRVRHIIDGDTVIIENGWHQITIRLDAIDCPEDGQPWGDKAKFGLIKLIGGRNVHMEEHGLDRHGRTLATLYV